MRDDDIDQALNLSAVNSPAVDPALLAHITQSIGASLQPVRPLAPTWMLIGGLALACGAVGVGGALVLGTLGVQKMNLTQILSIFPVLAVLIVLAASRFTHHMIPGGHLVGGPWFLPAMISIALAVLFATQFHDYRTERFVHQGMVCLTAGILNAVPAALAGWRLMHRGFAVDSVAAGIALGTFAGLAGVSMLELHCVNSEAPHVMLWHTAVVPLGAAVGVLVASAARSMRKDLSLPYRRRTGR